MITFASTLALSTSGAAPASTGAPEPIRVYVGTYSAPGNPGIHLLRFDPSSGRLASAGIAGEARNPSFLALSPDRRFLYAVDESSGTTGQPGGRVAAFAIDPDRGKLSRLNDQTTRGEHPCHLSLDRSGRFLFAANYSSGDLAVLPLGPDGRIGEPIDYHRHQGSGPNARRQERPHVHGVYPDPQNRYVLVPDLGIDRLVSYRLDSFTGHLEAVTNGGAQLPGGSGPRHLAFDPAGRFVYLLNELLSTITVHAWDADSSAMPRLQEISTLPPGFTNASSAAEIVVHPNGRFLYASNRGHDSLALFSIEISTGQLTALGHQAAGGRTPRHFAVDPTGRWLLAAHQDSNTIQVFQINPSTGQLTPVHATLSVPKPVCILFVPST